MKDYNTLQRRVEKLENIIAILKSVDCTASAPLREKLNALESLYGQYDVHTLYAKRWMLTEGHIITTSNETSVITLVLKNVVLNIEF